MFSEFYHRFGENAQTPQQYFCPGRINLIGEHIDYNGGYVLPAAISLGTTLTIRPRIDGKIRLQSANFDETYVFEIHDKFQNLPEQTWANYPIGCIHFLKRRGIPFTGADMYYESTLPLGSGLSSSASIEVLTLFALHDMFGDADYPLTQIALDAQHIENNFIGVSCGIMDQFAVAMGKEGHAIKLNCDTLEYEYIPADFGSYELVIISTNKPRQLVHSAYNQRLKECRDALEIINRKYPYKNLCDVPLSVAEEELSDAVLLARATHCITEQRRVLTACRALQNKDIDLFMSQLIQSHLSLRNNYEVTGKELDTLFDLAMQSLGCGAIRMTGAGFGGCAIALIEPKEIVPFKALVGAAYLDEIEFSPSFYECKISSGVRRVA